MDIVIVSIAVVLVALVLIAASIRRVHRIADELVVSLVSLRRDQRQALALVRVESGRAETLRRG